MGADLRLQTVEHLPLLCFCFASASASPHHSSSHSFSDDLIKRSPFTSYSHGTGKGWAKSDMKSVLEMSSSDVLVLQ